MRYFAALAILSVIGILFYVISCYNRLVKRRNRVDTQWAQIDVQLSRRAELIPNLVETVKGYASHEKAVLSEVTSARSQLTAAACPGLALAADQRLAGGLKELFALSEAYPQLQADKSFRDLQASLQETADKIAYARQFYNDTVLLYRDLLHQFPSSLVAKMFNFRQESYYLVSEVQRTEPKITL